MGLLSNVELNNTTYGIRSTAIPYGEVDSTSTSTAYTATIPEIKELSNGICMFLKNGVVTSAANFTININNLGAKPSYSNMATGYEGTAPTRDTTIFNVNYTMFFVYSEDIVDGGAWICYRGYDANTNTIGYQLRTNSTVMVTSDASRYYKIYFTSADGTKWVPAAASTTNSATSAKTVNQRPINPFGRIVYMSATTNFAAGANLTATAIWDQYNVTLGYSFNRTGAALTLTTKTPVYIKCAPQSDGSAIIDADNPYVQDLPSTADGKIYIFLGIATSATQVEIVINHPIYYYKDGAIRLWTNAADSGVTSVRVQGESPIQSSVSSTQSVSLDTTISLEDGYGDIKNPYEVKPIGTVLASGATVKRSYDDVTLNNSATYTNRTLESTLSLPAGSYVFSADFSANTAITQEGYVWVTYNSTQHNGNSITGTSSVKMNGTSSYTFTLATGRNVNLGYYVTSNTQFQYVPITISNIKLVSGAPEFRALTDDDIPKTNSYSATGTTAITGTGVAEALSTISSANDGKLKLQKNSNTASNIFSANQSGDSTIKFTTGSVGSASTGTAIPADDITAWTTNTPTSVSYSGGVLTITMGTAASLSYTAKSIPNISVSSATVVTDISSS